MDWKTLTIQALRLWQRPATKQVTAGLGILVVCVVAACLKPAARESELDRPPSVGQVDPETHSVSKPDPAAEAEVITLREANRGRGSGVGGRQEAPDLLGHYSELPKPTANRPSYLLRGVERPEVHVWSTKNCPACVRLKSDVRMREALATGFVWRYFDDRPDVPKDLRVYPTLYWKGAEGKWWKVEGWYGEEWFLAAYKRTQASGYGKTGSGRP